MRPDVVGMRTVWSTGFAIIILLSIPNHRVHSQAPLASAGGKLAGYVRDNTGRPMPSAQIWVDGTGWGGMADSGGYYLIKDLPVGAVDLTATMVGYGRVQVKGLQIADGQTVEQNFRLNPAGREEARLPQPQGQLVAEETVIEQPEIDDPPSTGHKSSAERIAGIMVSTPVAELPGVMLESAKRELLSRILGGGGKDNKTGLTGLVGQVTSGTSQPIPGAKIEVEGTPFVLTGEDGKFLIQPPTGRKLTLRISANGYRTLEVSLEKLKSGEARRVFLRLQQ
jgi:hypothetical protein